MLYVPRSAGLWGCGVSHAHVAFAVDMELDNRPANDAWANWPSWHAMEDSAYCRRANPDGFTFPCCGEPGSMAHKGCKLGQHRTADGIVGKYLPCFRNETELFAAIRAFRSQEAKEKEAKGRREKEERHRKEKLEVERREKEGRERREKEERERREEAERERREKAEKERKEKEKKGRGEESARERSEWRIRIWREREWKEKEKRRRGEEDARERFERKIRARREREVREKRGEEARA